MSDEVFKDRRVAELYGVLDTKVLTNEELLMARAKSLAERLRLTVIGEHSHHFEPREGEDEGGISLVLIITESHLAIHTWAKQAQADIDVFSCDPNTDMPNFRSHVMAEFPAERVKTRKVNIR